jgi:hypothetical protein
MEGMGERDCIRARSVRYLPGPYRSENTPRGGPIRRLFAPNEALGRMDNKPWNSTSNRQICSEIPGNQRLIGTRGTLDKPHI